MSDGRFECAKCSSRYSIKKINKVLNLANSFCNNLSVKDASKIAGCTILTAQKYYANFRKLITAHLEEEFNKNRENISEYNEYIYLDKSKRSKKSYIFDGQNFLTFDYGGRVYSIMMAPLSRYKNVLLDDESKERYYKELSKFLLYNKVARLKKLDNTILEFWSYLDTCLPRHKGIKPDKFIYYLKEAEFKFNYKNREKMLIVLRDRLLTWLT